MKQVLFVGASLLAKLFAKFAGFASKD